ncbi:hypothetical protein HIM_04099 [Hirsutella minnesotensis 3608]|uniref:Altered inheritance of mitochondria protein 24, mitochondrial n=1 Tax=Hirsutella minnesotensis 3608 TaxID=1043627 RepID=A0A0F7ZPZ7_9HYPO|nr:hypothetical protein HIM_04099 [Hirsutella minnesotensis 3608]
MNQHATQHGAPSNASFPAVSYGTSTNSSGYATTEQHRIEDPDNLSPHASPAFGQAMTFGNSDVGSFHGGSYRISHGDSNTILTVKLAAGCPLEAESGTMIAMSPTVDLQGNFHFSLKKMFSGGEMRASTFTGPGEVLLAPGTPGDITTIPLTANESWTVAKDAFLASTHGIVKDYKRQSMSKAMFSGEGLFLYKITGTGLIWVTSYGAIIKKTLMPGEEYIVDNGHLVAWSTKYVLERAGSGGLRSNWASGEGFVCRFTGPGTILFQTRNPAAFVQYLIEKMPNRGG